MAFRFGNNKYRAKRTEGFPSKLEAAVYYKLLEREKVGAIKNIKRQQQVVLQGGPRETRITWRIDFSFEISDTGELCYAEAKGIENADYKIKLKLFRANPPGRLEIWRGSYKNPKLVEIVERNPA